MFTSKYLSSALLLLIVVGLASGKSSHYPSRDPIEDNDSNNLKVRSYFYLSMPLFLRNAIDSFTSTPAPPITSTTTDTTSNHSDRKCNITYCLNGGYFLSINNGSCPSCLCTPNCRGNICETCSPDSTTSVSTTSYSPNWVCLNGGTPISDINGGYSCNCPYGHQGDLCEIQDYCLFYHNMNCNNGGMPSYNPLTGQCVCSCPACYYGSSCEFYDNNCDPSSISSSTARPVCLSTICMSGIKINATESNCQCACLRYQTGEYCELIHTFYTTQTCEYAGTPYYDLSSGRLNCACPPGFHGDNCQYTEQAYLSMIPTTGYNCQTMPCINGASVVLESNGSCWCNCSFGYQGDFCEYELTCQLNTGLTCENGGSAYYSSTSGCSCSCPACYYGSSCEYYDSNCNPSAVITQSTTVSPTCSTLNCFLGIVVQSNNSNCECACFYGYTGQYCELQNTYYNRVWCSYSGVPYYDSTSRSYKCACRPGFYGDTCDMHKRK